jgi:mono/diheme cytochrome c family protein
VASLTLRLRLFVLLPVAAVLASVPVAYSLAAPKTPQAFGPSALAPSQLAQGKQLYRKFCGQCHALSQALAAGFGSDTGLGVNGGPSFNDLRVPYTLSYVAVTEQFGGHELVVTRMTYPQLQLVCSFVQAATKANPYLARISDG